MSSPRTAGTATATATAHVSIGSESIVINMTNDQSWFSSVEHAKSINKQIMDNDVEIEYRMNQNIILRDNLRMLVEEVKSKHASYSIVNTCSENQGNFDNQNG
jgi:hypothetical protein